MVGPELSPLREARFCGQPNSQQNETGVLLQKFTQLPLARLPEPFDHHDWIFEVLNTTASARWPLGSGGRAAGVAQPERV
jgi:hypothetical protein